MEDGTNVHLFNLQFQIRGHWNLFFFNYSPFKYFDWYKEKSVISFGGFEPSNWNGSPMFYTLFLVLLSVMHFYNNKMRYLNAIGDFGHEFMG